MLVNAAGIADPVFFRFHHDGFMALFAMCHISIKALFAMCHISINLLTLSLWLGKH